MKIEHVTAVRARVEAYEQTCGRGMLATEAGYFRHVAAAAALKTHAAADLRALLDDQTAACDLLQEIVDSAGAMGGEGLVWISGEQLARMRAILEGINP
jgi:hypothetical protein